MTTTIATVVPNRHLYRSCATLMVVARVAPNMCVISVSLSTGGVAGMARTVDRTICSWHTGGSSAHRGPRSDMLDDLEHLGLQVTSAPAPACPQRCPRQFDLAAVIDMIRRWLELYIQRDFAATAVQQSRSKRRAPWGWYGHGCPAPLVQTNRRLHPRWTSAASPTAPAC